MLNRQCIALLHFSALPDVGGVEQLVQHQIDALRRSGHAVRLLTGSGMHPSGVDLCRIKEIACPYSDNQVTAAGREKIVAILVDKLRRALLGCHQCWVHNAFTVTLHPALSDALHILVDRMSDVRFINWVSDISALSAHSTHREALPLLECLAGEVKLKHITISNVRRSELARCTGINERDITVIAPPVSPLQWLDIDRKTRVVVDRLDLLSSELVVLVPAKLLPHKNLHLAVEVAAELRRTVPSHRMLITGSDSPHQPWESAKVRQSLLELIQDRRLGGTAHILADVCGGAVPMSVVRGLMRLVDLVFLPSSEEGFGLPVTESALLRIPCLCADIPAFREGAGYSTAFFSPTDASDSIARQVLSIVGGPANLDRRAVIRSWGLFAEAIADLAKSCVEG